MSLAHEFIHGLNSVYNLGLMDLSIFIFALLIVA